MEILKNIFLYGGALVGWGSLIIIIYAIYTTILDYKIKSKDIKTNEKKDNKK